jgi:hypothetical protein
VNLVIGIPTGGNPAKPFIESLSRIALPESVTGFGNVSITGNFAPAQRELIVRHALRSNADFLLMIDDDIIAPADTIVKLLSVFDSDDGCALVGGLYYSRDGLRPMAVADWDPANTTFAYTPAFTDAPVPVAGVGFGCVLVKCSVFQELNEPYFPAQVFLEETARRVRVCNEDYLFCHRVARLNRRAYLHAGVRLGHYDRESGKTFPEVWESEEVTGHNRMTVRNPDGSLALVPLDRALQAAGETHLPASLEYIFAR